MTPELHLERQIKNWTEERIIVAVIDLINFILSII